MKKKFLSEMQDIELGMDLWSAKNDAFTVEMYFSLSCSNYPDILCWVTVKNYFGQQLDHYAESYPMFNGRKKMEAVQWLKGFIMSHYPDAIAECEYNDEIVKYHPVWQRSKRPGWDHDGPRYKWEAVWELV